jgi:hypothetical protein
MAADTGLPDEWKAYKDDKGYEYYYNTVTGENTYTHPVRFFTLSRFSYTVSTVI